VREDVSYTYQPLYKLVDKYEYIFRWLSLPDSLKPTTSISWHSQEISKGGLKNRKFWPNKTKYHETAENSDTKNLIFCAPHQTAHVLEGNLHEADECYVDHTVHILTINISTKNARNKMQIMSSIELLHVSAPGCHPQEDF